MTTISLENVSRRFGAVSAVDGVDLEVKTGEFLTLLGPSGCGKTTTLRMVAGLEQNTGGRIAIGGEIVSDAAANYFMPPESRRLGMVFQSYAIWPHMTVFDNVAYPLRIRRVPAGKMRELVLGALKLVEMEAYAERPAPALSGGQQQRVAIARALVFEPRVLLLDEPLSNLDARLRTQTGDEFRSLQKRLGITSLYVTHDQGEAMALSDRVVVMHSGKMLQIGPPEEIYRRPKNRLVAEFFGAPNVLEARVVSAAPGANGLSTLGVEGAGWHGSALGDGVYKPGDTVGIMLRPENMRLAPEGADAMSWRGEVTASIFRGASRSVTVTAQAGTLSLDTSSFNPPAVGETVTVTADPAAAWAVAL